MKKILLRILLCLLLLWSGLWLSDYLAFATQRKAKTWERSSAQATELRFDAKLGYRVAEGWPRLDTKNVEQRLLLFLEERSLGLDKSSVEMRARELREKFADLAAKPLRLELMHFAHASTAQKALLLDAIPHGAMLVLCLSAGELCLNAAKHHAGQPLPVLERNGNEISATGLSGGKRKERTLLQDCLASLPTLRHLIGETTRTLKTSKGYFPQGLWPYRRRGAPFESRLYDATLLALELMQQRLRAAKGKLVVVWLPTALELDSQRLSACLSDLQLDTRDIESRRPARRLKDECGRRDIRWIDPSQVLRNALARGKRVLEEGKGFETRYTALGRRIVWRKLSAGIREWLRE